MEDAAPLSAAYLNGTEAVDLADLRGATNKGASARKIDLRAASALVWRIVLLPLYFTFWRDTQEISQNTLRLFIAVYMGQGISSVCFIFDWLFAHPGGDETQGPLSMSIVEVLQPWVLLALFTYLWSRMNAVRFSQLWRKGHAANGRGRSDSTSSGIAGTPLSGGKHSESLADEQGDADEDEDDEDGLSDSNDVDDDDDQSVASTDDVVGAVGVPTTVREPTLGSSAVATSAVNRRVLTVMSAISTAALSTPSSATNTSPASAAGGLHVKAAASHTRHRRGSGLSISDVTQQGKKGGSHSNYDIAQQGKKGGDARREPAADRVSSPSHTQLPHDSTEIELELRELLRGRLRHNKRISAAAAVAASKASMKPSAPSSPIGRRLHRQYSSAAALMELVSTRAVTSSGATRDADSAAAASASDGDNDDITGHSLSLGRASTGLRGILLAAAAASSSSATAAVLRVSNTDDGAAAATAEVAARLADVDTTAVRENDWVASEATASSHAAAVVSPPFVNSTTATAAPVVAAGGRNFNVDNLRSVFEPLVDDRVLMSTSEKKKYYENERERDTEHACGVTEGRAGETNDSKNMSKSNAGSSDRSAGVSPVSGRDNSPRGGRSERGFTIALPPHVISSPLCPPPSLHSCTVSHGDVDAQSRRQLHAASASSSAMQPTRISTAAATTTFDAPSALAAAGAHGRDENRVRGSGSGSSNYDRNSDYRGASASASYMTTTTPTTAAATAAADSFCVGEEHGGGASEDDALRIAGTDSIRFEELTVNARTWDTKTDLPSKRAYSLAALASVVVARVSAALVRDQTRSTYRRVSGMAGVILAATPLLVRCWFVMHALTQQQDQQQQRRCSADDNGSFLPCREHHPFSTDPSSTSNWDGRVVDSFSATVCDYASARFSPTVSPLLCQAAALVIRLLRMTGGARDVLCSVLSFSATVVVGGAVYRCMAHAEEAFYARYLTAKYFASITSAASARKHLLPHFRLHKIANLRMWLSLRSLLRRRGSRRAVDVAVITCFAMAIVLVMALVGLQGQRAALTVPGAFTTSPNAAAPTSCFPLPSDDASEAIPTAVPVAFTALSWLVLVYTVLTVYYLLRFTSLTSDVTQKHRDSSQALLLTEQMNLSLRMLRKPSRSKELSAVLNLLKLTIKLLKELEAPKRGSAGISLSPALFHATRIVVLSALSALASDWLGIKLRPVGLFK